MIVTLPPRTVTALSDRSVAGAISAIRAAPRV
jgi:hypothetical protein